MGGSTRDREGNFRRIFDRNEIDALIGLVRSMAVLRFAEYFSAVGFPGAVPSMASVEIEDEDGAVFAVDLDRLAGGGALVEQVDVCFVWSLSGLKRTK